MRDILTTLGISDVNHGAHDGSEWMPTTGGEELVSTCPATGKPSSEERSPPVVCGRNAAGPPITPRTFIHAASGAPITSSATRPAGAGTGASALTAAGAGSGGAPLAHAPSAASSASASSHRGAR